MKYYSYTVGFSQRKDYVNNLDAFASALSSSHIATYDAGYCKDFEDAKQKFYNNYGDDPIKNTLLFIEINYSLPQIERLGHKKAVRLSPLSLEMSMVGRSCVIFPVGELHDIGVLSKIIAKGNNIIFFSKLDGRTYRPDDIVDFELV